MSRGWKVALSPPAETTTADTGLRFTDILFGFVIRELFLRLQNWSVLDWFVRLQLIAAASLVLGSWIGFRRSLNRTTYEVKFFNLPLVRFLLDQGMVVLYFRIAVLTPTDPKTQSISSANLVHKTMWTLAIIFLLYALWDIGNLLMAASRKYPLSTADWRGFGITLGAFVFIGLLWIETRGRDLDAHGAVVVFLVATALLLIYRWGKEVRSSLRAWSDAAASTTAANR
jgi:ABC-type xylose transport system permease subunit